MSGLKDNITSCFGKSLCTANALAGQEGYREDEDWFIPRDIWTRTLTMDTGNIHKISLRYTVNSSFWATFTITLKFIWILIIRTWKLCIFLLIFPNDFCTSVENL